MKYMLGPQTAELEYDLARDVEQERKEEQKKSERLNPPPLNELENFNRIVNPVPVNGQINQQVSSNINYDNLFQSTAPPTMNAAPHQGLASNPLAS